MVCSFWSTGRGRWWKDTDPWMIQVYVKKKTTTKKPTFVSKLIWAVKVFWYVFICFYNAPINNLLHCINESQSWSRFHLNQLVLCSKHRTYRLNFWMIIHIIWKISRWPNTLSVFPGGGEGSSQIPLMQYQSFLNCWCPAYHTVSPILPFLSLPLQELIHMVMVHPRPVTVCSETRMADRTDPMKRACKPSGRISKLIFVWFSGEKEEGSPVHINISLNPEKVLLFLSQ